MNDNNETQDQNSPTRRTFKELLLDVSKVEIETIEAHGTPEEKGELMRIKFAMEQGEAEKGYETISVLAKTIKERIGGSDANSLVSNVISDIGRGLTDNAPQTLGTITGDPYLIAYDLIKSFGSEGDKCTLEHIQSCMEITGEEERTAIILLADEIKCRPQNTLDAMKLMLLGSFDQLRERKKQDLETLRHLRREFGSPLTSPEDNRSLRIGILTLTGLINLYDKQALSILNYLRGNTVEIPEWVEGN